MNRKNIILLCKAIFILLLYFIWPSFINEIYKGLSGETNTLIIECSKVLLIPLLYFMYKDDFKDDFIEFNKNKKKNILRTFKYFFVLFLLIFLANNLLELLASSGLIKNIDLIGNNENAINLTKDNMFLSGILLIIIYPIVEEIVFKKPLKDIIKNKWLFVFVTSIVYGYFNIASSITGISTILYIIPYATLSSVGAYYYYKTDNIIYPIALRVIYNAIVFIVNAVIILLGVSLW